MASQRSLALNKLVQDNEMLSEVEVATVVAPLLERLRVLHHAGEAHGNVSLATVAIRVVEPADGTIYLLDRASPPTGEPQDAVPGLRFGRLNGDSKAPAGIVDEETTIHTEDHVAQFHHPVGGRATADVGHEDLPA